MRWRLATLACLLIAASAAAAQAQEVDAGLSATIDPHIRVLTFDPDRVFRVELALGFQTMVQFAPGERIENVSIGDGAVWQVTPNKAATLLFVQPMDMATRTNMTVVTDRRTYLFELSASRTDSESTPYAMRFTYPVEAQAAAPPPPERRNAAYSYSGSPQPVPSVVFDDGRHTYFRWPDSSSVPAVFIAADDGSESLVNYSIRDGFHVVEQTAPRFVLRNGKDVTVLLNDGWREIAPAAGAPRRATDRTARGAHRFGQIR